jgi:hypothetical protein
VGVSSAYVGLAIMRETFGKLIGRLANTTGFSSFPRQISAFSMLFLLTNLALIL